jgi:hypothetical protein
MKLAKSQLQHPQPDQREGEMLRTAEAVAAEAPQLASIYQTAFAGEPWHEVSACAAPAQFEKPCPGGRSPQEIGETCPRCGEILRAPAFSEERLTAGWISHFNAHASRFYVERLPDGSCVLGALAWKASAEALAKRCYSAVEEEEMREWLADRLPGEFVWLEDIFADLAARPAGNLWNFRTMISQLLFELKGTVLAFRSINEGLIQKTITLFDPWAERLVALEDVPDRRDLVVVRPSP